MRADYHDADVRRAIYELYDTSFSRLSERIAISDRLGAVWHEVSTAFVAFHHGRAVSHVGVIEIPMVIGGRRRTPPAFTPSVPIPVIAGEASRAR